MDVLGGGPRDGRPLRGRPRALTGLPGRLVAGGLAVAVIALLWLATGPGTGRAPATGGPGFATSSPGRTGNPSPPGGEEPADPTDPATVAPAPADPRGGPRGTSPADEIPPRARTTSGAPGSPEARKEPDLLKRRDPVPEGVADQVTFFLGGGPLCNREDATAPGIRFPAGAVEIPRKLVFCFVGFAPTAPVTVTFDPPSGTGSTVVVPAPESEEYDPGLEHWVVPGADPGRHAVTARQGDLEAAAEFTVRRATAPRLRVELPLHARRGTDAHLYLGGFPPGRATTLHLYRQTSPGSPQVQRYRTAFSVPVDRYGEAHAVIDTKPDDPPGCYGVSSPAVLDPEIEAPGGFCLEK